MKKISVFLMILFLTSCKSDMEIISSIKQTVIPGLQSLKPYTNYVFEIEIKSDVDMTIDSVLVVENKKCYQPKQLIKKEGSARFTDKINSKGTYFVEAAIKKGNYKVLDGCNADKDKVVFYYTVNNQQKEIEIHSFIKKEKRRR